jgi:hypothetical protein
MPDEGSWDPSLRAPGGPRVEERRQSAPTFLSTRSAEGGFRAADGPPRGIAQASRRNALSAPTAARLRRGAASKVISE